MKKRKGSFILLICLFLVFVASAQSSRISTDTLIYNVPEFYRSDTIFRGDTAYFVRCYDKKDSLIKQVADYDQVRYYSLFQEYIDHQHTYKDADNKDQPLPVSIIVGRYDRLGSTGWMCVQYPGNKITYLRDDRSTIIRTDTTQQGDKIKIFRYYRSAPRP